MPSSRFERREEKEIAFMLKTPEKIRELRTKLYQKAKQEKEFRFYALYDKVWRKDIIEYAYKLVRAKKGAPGIDGVTFDAIESEGVEGYVERITEELRTKTYKANPVRRVFIPKPDGTKRPLGIPVIKDRIIQMAVKIVIEPIFEADFQESSYGFRPGRDAHKAMDEVSRQLFGKNTQVIDADITKYFDTIPHDRLLLAVAKRIVDKNILTLLRMWLKAPIVEEEKGKRRYTGNDKGVPQGGVISPLLANIYLNLFDVAMGGAKLVRYADDLVVLCRYDAHTTFEKMAAVLSNLGLTLNAGKTRIVDAAQEEFTFLGFTIRLKRNPRTGKTFPLTVPSKKAILHIRKEIKVLTTARNHPLPTEAVIIRLNQLVRGWVTYFRYQHSTAACANVRHYLEERVRTYLRRKHRKEERGYIAYPNPYLYERLGLYKIPTTAPWKVNASGRR